MYQDFDTDVAIVGYGPVGNTLAILLGQAGHSVVVLERWPEPYATDAGRPAPGVALAGSAGRPSC